MAPSILMLADRAEDYVADSLFHGLRTLLGADAVDFPKREQMYASMPPEQRSKLYGRGFGLYGLLEDISVDRSDVLDRARAGEFDAVIVGDIWRAWHWWLEVDREVPEPVSKAVVDGSDMPWIYPYGPPWWKTPRDWLLPRAHRRALYFKREWTRLSGRARLAEIAISYPAEKMVTEPAAKTQDFTSHVVDVEVAERLGGDRTRYVERLRYRFEREEDYLADLRASRWGVTTKRAGWDALRHYEIAANGAVPAFRRLDKKPPRCAPHGLVPGRNCIAYRDADDLFAQAGGTSDERHAELASGALAWARDNSTARRAEQVLARLGLAGG
ncbi:MAG TPA: hypothetical protein VF072_02040 [Thermoleophilaceae bacterium]